MNSLVAKHLLMIVVMWNDMKDYRLGMETSEVYDTGNNYFVVGLVGLTT